MALFQSVDPAGRRRLTARALERRVGGTMEHAQQIAGHASPKTTKLYDRTADTVTVDEISTTKEPLGRPWRRREAASPAGASSRLHDPPVAAAILYLAESEKQMGR